MDEPMSAEYLSRKDTVLAAVLNALFDGVYIVDKDRKILFWNRGAEEITGYRAEEVENHWCGDNILNHIDEKGNILCHGGCPLTRSLRTGEHVRKKVYPLHQSGRRFPVVTHVAPIRDEAGEIIAAIEVFRDVSQEEEFRLLQEKFNKLIARYVSSATLDEVVAQIHGKSSTGVCIRDLTVLYVDVVAFTSFSERHSGEEAVSLLNDIFGICEVITTEYNGDIDKFLGDCIMAVFVDANDAVGAARQVLSALGRLNKQRGSEGQEPVAVRIGINSGHVIQGDVGTRDRKDLTVIGDVVNTAARIQASAQPNSVYISTAAFSRLKDSTAFAYEGEIRVKNRETPIGVYRYAGEIPG